MDALKLKEEKLNTRKKGMIVALIQKKGLVGTKCNLEV